MDDKYTYAVTRVNVLADGLLSSTNIDKLITAYDENEFYSALQDTFLQEYLLEYENTDTDEALKKSLEEDKKMLVSISPEPELLEIIWLRYDFLNLKTLLKSKNVDKNELFKQLSNLGRFSINQIILAFEKNNLQKLDPDLATAQENAEKAKTPLEAELAVENIELQKIKKLAEKSGREFLKKLSITYIDFFNIKSALRKNSFKKAGYEMVFKPMAGGSLNKSKLKDETKTLESLRGFDFREKWEEPIRKYQETHQFMEIEKRMRDQIIETLQMKSFEVFTPAALFLYFFQKERDTEILRTITSGRNNKMNTDELRQIAKKNVFFT